MDNKELIETLCKWILSLQNELQKYKNREDEANGNRYPDGCYLDGRCG